MHILFVEDDKIIGKNVKEYLELKGFTVDWVADAETAFGRVLDHNYDAIILDVMLPGKDGFTLAKKIRNLKIQTPIIFLTAKEDLESKEKGFSSGGDDYLTKPFSLKELVLRLKSILKRSKNWDNINEISSGDITINLDTMEVTRNGKKIELTPKEFKILQLLMENEGKVLSKQEILESVWGINNDIRSDVVRTHIKLLRDKLNQGFSYDPIKTVRGIGFKFEN